MKHSIRLKMVITLGILLLSSLFVCWFLNKQFLSDYYVNYKVELMGTMFNEVDSAFNKYLEIQKNVDSSSESNENETGESISVVNGNVAFLNTMRKLEGNNNVSINVFKPWITRPVQMFFIENYYPTSLQTDQSETLKEKLSEYYKLREGRRGSQYMVKEDNYIIRNVFDDRMQSNYIELFGTTNDDTYIYIRSNFEGISESVEISNQFLAYVGVFVTIIGSIIMFFITRNFTRPIYQLSNIACAMSNLDFSVKYTSDRKDEIGVLGNSINTLSMQLEGTISDLKSANNALQKDIQNKIEVEEMRKEFLSNVTHELKTPIALIQGYAEGLKENISDDIESRNFYCEVIMDEAAKMNTMVKKLLTLNQIESSNNLISYDHFDLVAVIRSVIQSVEILCQQKNVNIEFNEENPLYAWADEYMIEEVITNYISNALNHVKEPNIIRITLQRFNHEVVVRVFNTGNPIPEEDIYNIWTKFYKVDKARTREYGGNGIGLSIVKAIMNAHNQSYGVENKEDGVEFYFTCDISNR